MKKGAIFDRLIAILIVILAIGFFFSILILSLTSRSKPNPSNHRWNGPIIRDGTDADVQIAENLVTIENRTMKAPDKYACVFRMIACRPNEIEVSCDIKIENALPGALNIYTNRNWVNAISVSPYPGWRELTIPCMDVGQHIYFVSENKGKISIRNFTIKKSSGGNVPVWAMIEQ